ncbi:flagellar biosynthesis protein FlgB [Curtobacterium sp. MCBD17_013]|uniref:flagellar basal body rod protein FlgB n=1 Tax=unclassified Curtobacterium TaxID=257496 RepID=UPI000DA6E570|nr:MULTISPECIES: flagellar basal body protein [unclassified Curtobacterium]PZF66559.1 flagellar biosynthesis protein FlgB [Curtobacterium sp. MCBD17_013]WIB65003.1 flagellar basal body protein [Curtobacterium sp. MCBD17_040]WIB68864.1 flagellar basal body protein [Curtobacterium sp. MCBD17_035]
MLDSVSTSALQSALDGLSLRQKVIANNVANINTPNYHAEKVQFEDALAQSVADGNGSTTPTIARSLEPTNTNGNNVDLDEETLSNVDTTLRYQFASQAMNAELTAVRAAMRTDS